MEDEMFYRQRIFYKQPHKTIKKLFMGLLNLFCCTATEVTYGSLYSKKKKVKDNPDLLSDSLLSCCNTYFYSIFCTFASQVFQLDNYVFLFLLKRYNLISQIYIFKSGSDQSSFYIGYKTYTVSIDKKKHW